jgi:hypothetical protein
MQDTTPIATVLLPLGGKYGKGLYVEIDQKHQKKYENKSIYATDKGRAKYKNAQGAKPQNVFLHRDIMGLKFGDKVYVDHRDGNPLRCVEENMRVCTTAQNLQNARPRNGRAFKGTYKDGDGDRWKMMICANGKKFYRGGYPTELDAALAYNEHAKCLHGEFARLNDLPKSFVPSLPIEDYLPIVESPVELLDKAQQE